MDERLMLSDGTAFLDSHALQNGNLLFVYIKDENSDIRTVFDALYDSTKTNRITYYLYKSEIVFDGFTKLMSVRDEDNGMITAYLKKV